MKSLMSFVAVLTGVSVSGCSFLASQGPPPNHERMADFHCSGNFLPPVLDTAWATASAYVAVTAAAQNTGEWTPAGNTPRRSMMVGVGLLSLAFSGASAIYGYEKAAACHEARERLAERQAHRPAAWPQYPAYPPGRPAPIPPATPQTPTPAQP